ncbi:MAG: hypothetical protein OXU65_02705 [Deltaproteobacteria bacterium]|nr:hypothetical protein [Deltaproteobacteria bacterium]
MQRGETMSAGGSGDSRAGADGASGAERPAGRVAASRPVAVGRVRHYFPRAGAAVVTLSDELRLGDWVHICGEHSDFVQRVSSLARDGEPVRRGGPGQEIGLALEERARPGDRVFRMDN